MDDSLWLVRSSPLMSDECLLSRRVDEEWSRGWWRRVSFYLLLLLLLKWPSSSRIECVTIRRQRNHTDILWWIWLVPRGIHVVSVIYRQSLQSIAECWSWYHGRNVERRIAAWNKDVNDATHAFPLQNHGFLELDVGEELVGGRSMLYFYTGQIKDSYNWVISHVEFFLSRKLLAGRENGLVMYVASS